MKERPILFSAPMVRAILNGSKSQTRRVVKPQFDADAEPVEMGATNERGHQISGHSGLWWDDCEGNPEKAVRCPYGQPGDRFWVREAHWWFKDEPDHSCGYYPPKLTIEDVEYRADGEKAGRVWRPSIHMPRWASRITLEVTDVRVERLQDIGEADAIAEGATPIPDPCDHARRSCGEVGCSGPQPYRAGFRSLWESINGPGSWGANPWVWALEFTRVGGAA